MRSTGRRSIGLAVAAAVLLSEGVNAVQMYRIGSPFFVALLEWVLLVLVGLSLYGLPAASRGFPASETPTKCVR